jgi:hypothetical protein
LGDRGYEHLKVNHSLNFVDADNPELHTNGVESNWRHTKGSFCDYNKKKEFFGGYLAKHMFMKGCKAKKADPWIEFFKCAGRLYSPINHAAAADDSTADDSTAEIPSDAKWFCVPTSEIVLYCIFAVLYETNRNRIEQLSED